MARINVYAYLPRIVALGADLDLHPNNWHWVHCLTLPLETLNALQFSHKPYKWIRYAIGVVIGAEGLLSTSPDSESPNVVDYNAVPPAESADLYYHTSDEERQRMFPVDPNIVRTRITSSLATTRKDQFREDVARRDGSQCLLTAMEARDCDATHLLAHSKGDMYITTYTQRRSRSPGDDIIQEIDSVRNGLFLNAIAHRALGKDIAFLITPNFAMDTTDIDPTAPPAEKRYTAHVFVTPVTPLLTVILKPGSLLQISETSESPPPILFDGVYAGAVLHHFGTQTLKKTVVESWKDTFYPDGVMNAAHADYTSIVDGRPAPMESTQNRARERMARYEARDGPDTFDMLMMIPYALVPPNELQAMLRTAREKAEAAEQSRLQEKVNSWIRQVDTG